MKKIFLIFTLALMMTSISWAAGKIQNEDVKSLSELTSAGGSVSQLINDTKIYLTNGSISEQLSSAISDGKLFQYSSPLTTKGDLLGYSTTTARLPVGSDGQVLSADSTQTTGLKWISAAAASTPVTTKTANYTLTGTDYTVIADASGGSFTLTLPSASSVPNQIFILKRQDNTLANPVTISGTIDGATDWKLYTQNETLKIQSDGTSYYQLSHLTNTPWINAGSVYFSSTNAYTFTIPSSSVTQGAIYSHNGFLYTVTITISSSTTLTCSGTGTPLTSGTLTLVSGTGPATLAFSARTITGVPVKGTAIFDNRWWRREGDSIHERLEFAQSAAGTAGSGDYLLYLYQTLDTSKVSILNSSTFGTSLSGSGFGTFNVNNTSTSGSAGYRGSVVPFDAHMAKIIGVDAGGASAVMASWQSGGSAPWSGSSSLSYNADFVYPVLGWKP